jgi:hypothetical protein
VEPREGIAGSQYMCLIVVPLPILVTFIIGRILNHDINKAVWCKGNTSQSRVQISVLLRYNFRQLKYSQSIPKSQYLLCLRQQGSTGFINNTHPPCNPLQELPEKALVDGGFIILAGVPFFIPEILATPDDKHTPSTSAIPAAVTFSVCIFTKHQWVSPGSKAKFYKLNL